MSRGKEWSAEVSMGTGTVHCLKAGEEGRIPKLIEELTEELSGAKSEGGFSESEKYIDIKLVSPDVPDLTIIDLPGIVRTTTRDQSDQVRRQVDGLLNRFLQQKRTIILAVIPSYVDIATVDILQRAEAVDPDGLRTIGVLTRPDLVDKDAEGRVIDVLANRTKPLKHGYFMLQNRCQEEPKEAESAEEAREREHLWLQSSKFAGIPGVSDSRLGVNVLTTALTELLVQHIEGEIPSIIAEVQQNLKDTEKKLEKLGEAPPSGDSDCRGLARRLVNEFCSKLRPVVESTSICEGPNGLMPSVFQQERYLRKKFLAAVGDSKPGWDGERDSFEVEVVEVPGDGTLKPGVKEMNVGEVIQGCVRDPPCSISRIGDEVVIDYPTYGFSTGKIVGLSYYFRGDLADRIEERRGRELPGFMSFPVFSDLLGECVEHWKQPSEVFQSAVCDGLKKTALALVSPVAEDWPYLLQDMKEEVITHLDETKAETSRKLLKLLQSEKIPFTENQSLWDTINKIRDDRLREKLKSLDRGDNLVDIDAVYEFLRSDIGSSSNESQEVQDMIDMLKVYWEIAQKRYMDNVCMVVSEAYTKPSSVRAIETRLHRVLVDDSDEYTLRRFFEPSRVKEKRRVELEQTVKSMSAARLRLRKGIERCT